MVEPGGFHRQSDAVYEELRRLIIRTDLPPGSLIEESVLMDRLNVGRTPLREALQRLVQEEFIRNVPRRPVSSNDREKFARCR